jgi:hypothetical protein
MVYTTAISRHSGPDKSYLCREANAHFRRHVRTWWSAFIVFQPALRIVVDYYSAHKAEIEKFTDGHWAGDCVLGKTFTDAGVPFTNAWPAFQVDYPGLVQYTRANFRPNADKLRLWCGTPVSYHHMSAAMVEEMWNFEQDWISHNDPVSLTHCQHRRRSLTAFHRSLKHYGTKTSSLLS